MNPELLYGSRLVGFISLYIMCNIVAICIFVVRTNLMVPNFNFYDVVIIFVIIFFISIIASMGKYLIATISIFLFNKPTMKVDSDGIQLLYTCAPTHQKISWTSIDRIEKKFFQGGRGGPQAVLCIWLKNRELYMLKKSFFINWFVKADLGDISINEPLITSVDATLQKFKQFPVHIVTQA